MSDEILLHATWIAPMTGPVIPNGGVVFRGHQIVAVDCLQSLRTAYPNAILKDAGDAIILPGLINAHTHLELTLQQRSQNPARFVDWIMQLMKQPIDPNGMQAGIDQCIRFGITTVGDITSQPNTTRTILAQSRLNGTSYGEVRAMAQRRKFLEPRLQAAIELPASENVCPGISPHAPYSLEIGGYSRCLELAKQRSLPLTTHLAETPDEATFLADHTGPFKELWDHLNAWDSHVPTFTGGPIRFAKSIGLLDFPTLLAHMNYCDDDELDLLARGQASVVMCPRTHAYFGHPPHRWRDMLAKGINVVVGTDSCASSLDLNLVDDLRLLHQIAPEVDPMILWQMATISAANALLVFDRGRLDQGMQSNFVIFPTVTNDPLREILETDGQPSEVWNEGVLQRSGVPERL